MNRAHMLFEKLVQLVLLDLIKTMVELLILEIHKWFYPFRYQIPKFAIPPRNFLFILLLKMHMMSEVAIVQKRQLQFIHVQRVNKITCSLTLIPQSMCKLQTIWILVAVFIGGQISILFCFVWQELLFKLTTFVLISFWGSLPSFSMYRKL